MYKLLVLSFVMGCAISDRVALVASTTAIACDAGLTGKHAEDNWREPDGRMRYYNEHNPILRDTPAGFVYTYFAVATSLNIIIWKMLPPKYRTVYGLVVTAVETYAIVDSRSKYVCR